MLRAVQKADQDLTLAQALDLLPFRPGDLDDDVGLRVDPVGLGDHPRPGLLVVGVEVVAAARAGFHDHLEAVPHEPGDGLWHEPDPLFPLGGFPGHSDLHA